MMLDHASGAQRRTSSVTVPLARGGASLEDCGLTSRFERAGPLTCALARANYLFCLRRTFASRAGGALFTTPRPFFAEKRTVRSGRARAPRPAWGEGAHVNRS